MEGSELRLGGVSLNLIQRVYSRGDKYPKKA